MDIYKKLMEMKCGSCGKTRGATFWGKWNLKLIIWSMKRDGKDDYTIFMELNSAMNNCCGGR